MWLLAVCLLAAGGAARSSDSSDVCRPLSEPEPDTEHVTAVEGTTARLYCGLDARRSATSWARLGRRGGRLIALGMGELAHIDRREGSERYRLERGVLAGRRPRPQWVLAIEPVRWADAGLYRCYAMYERPEMASSRRLVRLTVAPAGGGARLAGPRRRTVIAGQELELSCTGRLPLSWRLDGGPVPAAAAVTKGRDCSRLRLEAVTAADAGVYTCGAPGESGDSVRVAVVTEVATVVEMGPQYNGAHLTRGCDVLVILALCCHYCTVWKWT